MDKHNWFLVKDTKELRTPSLLVFPERIAHNIEQMLKIAGGPENLRPHIKTYKMAEVISMQMKVGINKFKCATIAEAELLAKTGAKDALLAMQPVGPNMVRILALTIAYPKTQFSCLADNLKTVKDLSVEAAKQGTEIGVFVDINNGMDRTGIPPNEEAFQLYKTIHETSHLTPRGLHVYDGHLRLSNFEERKKACNEALAPVIQLRDRIDAEGIKVESLVVGGSPTFPVHTLRKDVATSPGTTLLWDEGYGSKFKDMPFKCAAVLVTRIISKPAPNQICLDLGHKSIASEMPFPRLQFLNTHDFEQLGQSEEHLLVKTSTPEKFAIGDLFYAVPMHICPTVAKYPSVMVIEEGKVVDSWKVAARDHKITI